jgi:Xaa-Pro aminopeptidase
VADRRPARLAALASSIESAHLDGLLLGGPANIRYLTGFSGTSALLLVTQRQRVIITDFRYETQVADEVGDAARIVVERQSLWTGLWRELAAMPGISVLGFESASLVHRDFQRLLEEGSRWQWRPTTGLVEALRERKDPDELALIRQAADVAVRALEETLPQVRAGMTELEVAGALEHALRRHGSTSFPFPSIVASGPRAALPHARSSARRIEAGDFLLLDFGAEVGGYCADITRTVVVGRASDEQRAVYEIVRAANELASAGVRAGLSGRDADAIARDYIDRRGFGEAFGHSLGHGIGLEVHEAPRLARTAEAPLAGWGGVRIEDDVHLAAGGPQILTRFPRELLELP